MQRSELAQLRDGRAVSISPVTPASRPLLERAMSALSPETSRRRFFTVRYRLSAGELDALTILDGVDRFAVGATVCDAQGELEGIGVARYVRSATAPDAAEVAVVVVDAYQGQGIGKTLLARLAAEARARGIVHCNGIVLPDNYPMLGLLARHAPGVAVRRTDDHLTVDMPLA